MIPASPWLDAKFLLKPKLKIGDQGDLEWKAATYDRISLWLLQTKENGHWQTRILPGSDTGTVINGSPEIVALTAIDRCGVASPAVVMQQGAAAATK